MRPTALERQLNRPAFPTFRAPDFLPLNHLGEPPHMYVKSWQPTRLEGSKMTKWLKSAMRWRGSVDCTTGHSGLVVHSVWKPRWGLQPGPAPHGRKRCMHDSVLPHSRLLKLLCRLPTLLAARL